MKRVLTIAGSDSGGGAGIQADLKTFGALGVFGASAITAITAQNTVAVTRVDEVAPDMVAAQIVAVAEDIGFDAAKTGMLASRAIIEAIVPVLKQHGPPNLVVDPVMISKSGARLLRDDAVASLKSSLFPLAELVTPNIPEAEALTGRTVADPAAMKEAARQIHDLGPRAVVIKGGHVEGPDAVDLYFDGRAFEEVGGERVNTRHTHGTGCTFSAAIAAYLARGLPPLEAVSRAKQYLIAALRSAPGIGQGCGPVDHFHAFVEK